MIMENNNMEKRPKILITGASGFIGRELFLRLKHMDPVGIKFSSKHDFCNKNIITADLTDISKVRDIIQTNKPDIIFHFAALASPAVNEANIEVARLSHLSITENILKSISEDVHVVYLSTDKVFDGSNQFPDEQASTNPLWIYGELKLLCENMIKENIKKYHILRLPIVHSLGSKVSKSFIDDALMKIKRQESVKVFDNVFRCYVLLSDLLDTFEKILCDDHYGIYHIGTDMKNYYVRLRDLCTKENIEYKDFLQSTQGTAKPMNQNLNTEKINKLFLNQKFV